MSCAASSYLFKLILKNIAYWQLISNTPKQKNKMFHLKVTVLVHIYY